jgi:hypothetical protein
MAEEWSEVIFVSARRFQEQRSDTKRLPWVRIPLKMFSVPWKMVMVKGDR